MSSALLTPAYAAVVAAFNNAFERHAAAQRLADRYARAALATDATDGAALRAAYGQAARYARAAAAAEAALDAAHAAMVAAVPDDVARRCAPLT